jgi:hypothetical protein
MKNFLFLLIVPLFLCTSTFCQKDTIRLKKTETEKRKVIVTDRAPQAWYFGVGGSGLIFSANYDRRFGKKLGGPGFTAGLGFFFGGGLTLVTIPASLNYLVGKMNHFFEIAAGGTYVTGSVDWGDLGSSSGSGFIWHINGGYRYQPAAGGFFFRAGFSPLFASGGGSVMSYYLGGGVAF